LVPFWVGVNIGRISFVWGQVWSSAESMHGALCTNMCGGVPIDVIEETVRLSRLK
jgi:hypothetical protein